MKFTNNPKYEDLMRSHQSRGGGQQVYCDKCDRWVRTDHAHEADSDE